jgi:hypothetical protein
LGSDYRLPRSTLTLPKTSKKRFFTDLQSAAGCTATGCHFINIPNFKTMLPFIIALFWAFICPNHTNTNHNHNSGQVTTMDDGDGGDTGGENGTIPPKPPKP